MKRYFIILLTLGIVASCATSKNNNTDNDTIKLKDVTVTANKAEKTKVPKIITRPVYHGSVTKKTDLIHTAIHVSFNWENSTMNGVADITLKPHFYPTDSLILNAKAMQIYSITMNGKPLHYKYDDAAHLRIYLGRTFTRSEKYTIHIKYLAQPEKVKSDGSSAITEAKGLYFINPKGTDPYEMPQIWTQGETQASSAWFPTLDAPNQKMTQEIWMTVAKKYKTLSNGTLVSSKDNGDGTRTDYWRRNLKAAPYLTMMAVGEFSIVKDSYTKENGTVIPVDYYVEPQWKDDAKAIFGQTPNMIKFFSKLLGVDFQWDKYDQIVAREYVSGAMENTGATLLGDFLYQTKRELIDGNQQSVISHELFHHWFGDLVTTESWSNITLNESFADYGQYLWAEHHIGRDQADYEAEKEINQYYMMESRSGSHNLVWYDYDGSNKEAVFDLHSYNKGGRIVHMLRTYLGDSAFFKGLNLYLNQHKFGTAEVANLRMAMEKVSGQDLNWFFNEWYFGAYHPILNITQKIGDGTVTITVQQTQDLKKAPLYRLPLNVAIYANNKKTIHPIVVDKSSNTYTFSFNGTLQNIVIDDDRATLGKFNYDKPKEWYVYQYSHGPHYKDREEAVRKGSSLNTPAANQMVLAALKDKFWAIRKLAITKLDRLPNSLDSIIYQRLINIAKNDKNSHVRSEAISTLSKNFSNDKHKADLAALYHEAIDKDSSYLVMSTALNAIAKEGENGKQEALKLSKSLQKEESSALKSSIMALYALYGDSSNLDFMANTINQGAVRSYDAIGALFSFTALLKKQNLSTMEKYYPVFERLSNKGGAYISRVLPMSLMQLKSAANQKVTALNKQLKKLNDNGKSGEATILQGKVNKGQHFIDNISKLLQK